MPDSQRDPAAEWLDSLAAQVSSKLQLKIERGDPRDRIYTWDSASVHPLQLLETQYQKIVRDAAEGAPNLQIRRAEEEKEMRRYFHFGASELRLLGVRPGEPFNGKPFPLIADGIRQAHEWLKAAGRAMKPLEGRSELGVALARLNKALSTADAVLQDLTKVTQTYREPPKLGVAREKLEYAARELRRQRSDTELKAASKNIGKALESLAALLKGLGSVSLTYAIADFYLFRLLVRYEIDSKRTLTADAVAVASGELTGLLNAQEGMFDWVEDRVADLARRLAELQSQDILFFLKGGRALAYRLSDRRLGKNDWDTQIVINPNLPAAKWYELFLLVSNIVLVALEEYKVQFYLQLQSLAASRQLRPFQGGQPVRAVQADEAEPQDRLGWDADQGAEEETAKNCKAEIIDVGLPRYDSIEAREQWMSLRDHIIRDGAVPYPDYAYFVEEYILMTREVFAGKSNSPGKMPTRLQRLYQILHNASQPTPPESLKDAASAIDERFPSSPEAKTLWYSLLLQFAAAYRLEEDKGFAVVLDGWISTRMRKTHRALPEPSNTPQGSGPQGYDNNTAVLWRILAYAAYISEKIESHLVERSQWFYREINPNRFIKKVCENWKPTVGEDWELELALNGNMGAMHLFANARRNYSLDFLDPIVFVSLGLYSVHNSALGEMLPELEGVIENANRDLKIFENPVLDMSRGIVRAQCTQRCAFRRRSYQPLGVVSRFYPLNRPLLAYVGTLPVISARDLLREFRAETAAIQEFGRRSKMRATVDAIASLVADETESGPITVQQIPPVLPPQLLQAGNGAVALPALVGGAPAPAAAETIGHLMISSNELAVRRVAAYPASYEPDAAFLVTLTPNRPALRQALTWPAAATLDLLVINQGEGGIGSFAGWPAQDLQTYLVQPLLDSGVRANLVVLDFNLSASLLPVFTPLCAPGAAILSRLYSISADLVTTGFWNDIRHDLATHAVYRIQEKLLARARLITRDLTGKANLGLVTGWSEAQTANYLSRHNADFDPISIIRYLPKIASVLTAPLSLTDRYWQLRRVQALPSLGAYERAVLDPVAPWPIPFNARTLAAVEAGFRARLVSILTAPEYGLRLDTAGRDLFGEDGLWSLYDANRAELMALARSLPNCPTCFATWTQGSSAFVVDAALGTDPMAETTRRQLRRIDEEAPRDAAAIIDQLRGTDTVPIIDRRPQYLQ
jgi:hypothetical protein